MTQIGIADILEVRNKPDCKSSRSAAVGAKFAVTNPKRFAGKEWVVRVGSWDRDLGIEIRGTVLHPLYNLSSQAEGA